MNNFIKKNKIVGRTVLVMIIFGVIFSTILEFVYNETNPIILKSEAEAKERLLLQVVKKEIYNNDLINSYIEIPPNQRLKNNSPIKAYVAKKGSKVTAVIIETRAPNGYSGEIKILVGINSKGNILGTRVIKHQETPGLGDYIDINKSEWINIFTASSLKNTSRLEWGVKKDQGKFDYVSGATITARAVIVAINEALIYFKENKLKMGIDV
ncbi:electron transport complex subunit RsxG [Methylophilaceae bacterium]|jgi:Na+-translocating ferredoxin:NAD+ oxidoreductase subunit G|nr:electron transport complex subunit RsxG [Methylophilaceae bacterium]